MSNITDDRLRDKAYLLATGSTMVEDFNYSDYQTINCSDYAWEPFEHWPESAYSSHVTGLAESIYTILKEVRDVDANN